MCEPKPGRGAPADGGFAAMLASSCCLGRPVLVALGSSGAWLGNLTVPEPYPILIAALTNATEKAGYPAALRD